MSRLTIEISGQEHQEIKAMAAMQGKSLKEFVMERIFPEQGNENEEKKWEKLKSFLLNRIEAAESSNSTSKSMTQIAEEKMSANQ